MVLGNRLRMFVVLVCVGAWALPTAGLLAADLRDGSHERTRWNEGTQRLELDPAPDARGGVFTSPVLDAGAGQVFISLGWLPDLAYGKGLPARDTVEHGYLRGNADLRDALALERGEEGSGGSLLLLPVHVDPKGPQAITVFGWVRETEDDSTSFASGSAGPRLRVRWQSDSGAVKVELRDDAGREVTLAGAVDGSATPRAHHVAIVLDGSEQEASFYLDGRLTDEARIAPAPSGFPRVVEIAGAAAAPFGSGVPEAGVVARALPKVEIETLALRGLARVRLQVARCADAICADPAFVGPDGTGASYFDEQGLASGLPPEWSLAAVQPGQRMRYRMMLESADPLVTPAVSSVVTRTEAAPLQPLADSDGDGVDDALDCAPFDGNTWAVPSEATGLLLSGNPPSFSWTPPSSPGGNVLRYDVLRATAPNAFGPASVCLIRNLSTTSPAATDPAPPGPQFSYLVQSKNACGGNVGVDSQGAPRAGRNCLFSATEACTASFECVTGCCTGTCVSLGTISNCASCGNACGGQTPTSDAVCNASTCGMTCKGENYDADSSVSDGCEQADSPTGNHSQGTATNLGSIPCTDSSTFSVNGSVPSDNRTHNPAVTGFNAATGAAPDYLAINATGGFACINDYAITLATSGGSASLCYRLTVATNVGTFNCTASGQGSCTITRGSGSYSDGTTISISVEKTCNLPTVQQVSYTVSGHL